MEKEITLDAKVRMLLGKLWHLLVEIFMKGEKEVGVKGEINGMEVVGRADGVTDDAVIELKSGRGPKDGAWYGDYLQALTYAYLFNKNKIIIKYRDSEVVIEVTEDDFERLKIEVERYKLIVEGYLPPPKRSKWCEKCPFKDLCEELGDEWDGWFGRMDYVKRVPRGARGPHRPRDGGLRPLEGE